MPQAILRSSDTSQYTPAFGAAGGNVVIVATLQTFPGGNGRKAVVSDAAVIGGENHLMSHIIEVEYLQSRHHGGVLGTTDHLYVRAGLKQGFIERHKRSTAHTAAYQ